MAQKKNGINILIIVLIIIIIVLFVLSIIDSSNCIKCNSGNGNIVGNVYCYNFIVDDENEHKYDIESVVICVEENTVQTMPFKKIIKKKYPDVTKLDGQISVTYQPTSDYDFETCKYKGNNLYVYYTN